jgi:uncharacterized protein YndB with AHSA1/START domain
MAKANEKPEGARTSTLTVSRTFTAASDLVFRAWSSAEHLKRWFCPEVYTVPEAEVEFRVGGAFDICMQSPQGQRHWTRGRFVEIVPNKRLVIEMEVPDDEGKTLFRALLEADFSMDHGVTRLEVRQTFTILDPRAAPMIQGAPMGWQQTLDRLEREVARIQQLPPASRSVVHAMFCIERTYPAAPAQVFKAFTDPAAKAKWFGSGEGLTLLAREMDVRPGGREHLQGRWNTGMVSTFDAVYFDVVPDQRLVYAYEMHLDQRKISVSLATVELKPAGTGTRLVMTEQGAFLDGYDDAGSREQGTNFLLDAMGRSLQD